MDSMTASPVLVRGLVGVMIVFADFFSTFISISMLNFSRHYVITLNHIFEC